MFRIEHTRQLGPGVKLFHVHAPRIARKHRAGQFVIVRVHEQGERIPLTIAESDPQAGLITIVVQAVGKTTTLLNSLAAGDQILDVVGPLGKPSDIQDYGTAVVIGGGVGTAIAWPTARALKEAGTKVISIIGGRNQDLVILLDEVRAVSDRVIVTTDDGSMGRRGLVTDALKDVLGRETPGLVLAIGPIPMMRAVSDVTRDKHIRTIVSLNSIMVDGTGMCGGCRVLVEGASQFACVDGPEFDAHLVNFDVLAQRNRMYREAEVASMAEFNENPERDYEIMRRSGQLAECALEQVATMTVEGA